MAFYERGICCCAFSRCGRWLVAVGLDNKHAIGLWDWREGTLLAAGSARTGDPFAAGAPDARGQFRGNDVHDAVWCPATRPAERAAACDFVTFGKGHVHFWKVGKPTAAGFSHGLRCVNGKFKTYDPPARTMCAAFTPDGDGILTGGDNGKVYTWSAGGECTGCFNAHAGQLRSLAICCEEAADGWTQAERVAFADSWGGGGDGRGGGVDGGKYRLYTGGSDGMLHEWNLTEKGNKIAFNESSRLPDHLHTHDMLADWKRAPHPMHVPESMSSTASSDGSCCGLRCGAPVPRRRRGASSP